MLILSYVVIAGVALVIGFNLGCTYTIRKAGMNTDAAIARRYKKEAR